jgi:DNA-binding transcriptional ArsR family regulator
MKNSTLTEILPITDGPSAAVLVQHPLRRRILAAAREPVSATELAGQFGLARQKVNYHVRQLAKAGFLRLAGRRVRRNLIERQYQATAQSYVLAPQLLGPVAASGSEASDPFSASYLLGLTSLAQRELTALTEAASQAGVRVLTLSVMSEIRFESAEQRAAFGRALTEAVTTVMAEHTTPFVTATGEPGKGRPFRLIIGCHPIPIERESTGRGRD